MNSFMFCENAETFYIHIYGAFTFIPHYIAARQFCIYSNIL